MMLENHLAPLLAYLDDPSVVEIQANEPGILWVETVQHGLQPIEIPELTSDYYAKLGSIVANTNHATDYDRRPYVAAALPGGHRMQLCRGNSIKSGIAMSIRPWRERRYTLDDYDLSPDQLAIVQDALKTAKNILISGGMFSGKTTFTNALIELIPPTDRVISIEDTPELDLTHIPNRAEFIVQRLATNEEIDYPEVLKAVMRLRPDRTLIGELNDTNTALFGRILNMGHGGTISTIHADSPELSFAALSQNAALGGLSAEANKANNQVFRDNLALIIQLNRDPKTYKRRVTHFWKNPAQYD